MHNVVKVWLAGWLAITATAGSTVFNGILAVTNTSNKQLVQVLRVLLFVALGFSFVGTLTLFYYTAFYVRNIKRQSLHLKKSIWGVFMLGILIGFISLALPLLTLIWLTVDQSNITERILDRAPIVWLAAWFGCWGASALAQFTLFVILGVWTQKQLRTQSVGRLDIDFGTRLPPTPQDLVPDEYRSFHSRDTTMAEVPRTPPAKRPISSRNSASLRATASSSRTRLTGVNLSAKSSLDMVFPAGEAQSIDNAFDRWDTSSVHSEMRAAVGSSPIARMGLETIPGSRPESPEDALDGPFLPSSPQVRSGSPQAITSDTATTLGDWSSSPSRYVPVSSSPPSSPPNFSRPTSKQKNQPMNAAPVEILMQETIHPLFRASSPHPPPIATSGTMVTASPLANQPITPRTLANLRSHSKSLSSIQPPKLTGHWRAMPSVSQNSERRPSTSGSLGPSSPPPGSPGPSIVDEEELPPILPGFVLSAGQRTSMLGYANRKSIKRDRRGSQMSNGMGNNLI